MLNKLEGIYQRFLEISKQMTDNDIISDQEKMTKLYKENAELSPIVEKYLEYKKYEDAKNEAELMLADNDDEDFKAMLEEEIETSKEKMPQVLEELKILLLPKNPDDDKNVIIEIRGGAGGDEAALFGADLMRMYTRYAERNNWKTETLSSNITDIGGVKEVSFSLEGKGAYSRLKFESGVHRVQRIPSTESGGRIHTSTVTVAVLPEVEEVEV